ncbi:MAG: type III pantothenate kinase [Oscillospiraceae bacterium]|nr:type III pantothenate kinase [Oscillospiraceae bacterium]
MILCIDVGNTNIVFAAYDGEEHVFTSRFKSDVTRTSDQYAAELRAILSLNDVSAIDIDGAIIGSVVPQLTSMLRRACKMVLGHDPLVVGAGVRTGLNIRLDNPAECGADLVASAVAAKEHYPAPLLVVDLGTASKVTAVGINGDFLGGAIMPGLMTSMDALIKNASLLTAFDLSAPKKAIGTNTPDCLKSGYVLGFASMIDGMCDRFKAEMEGDVTVVATGGNMEYVLSSCRTKMIFCDDLVTEGLRIIYEKNR